MAASQVTELSQTETRERLRAQVLELLLPVTLILAYILLAVGDAFDWPPPDAFAGLLLFLLTCALWMAARFRPRLATWLAVGGALACVGLAWVWWGNTPMLFVLAAIPASLATLLLGGVWGVAIAAAATLILVVSGESWSVTTDSLWLAALVILWFVEGLMLIAIHTVSLSIEWSTVHYRRMRDLLEEARDQRTEMKQVQEDLLHANLELERLSERLAAMRQLAEEARKAKEEFVANVSHELRTPLNMIIGFSEMIGQSPDIYDAPLPPALLADIAVIRRNAQHLASMVDDVLDLSQLDAGRMALGKEWVSFPQIVQAATVAVQPLFETKGLYLNTDVPDDLPPISCDPTRIRQVVLNLLSNAGRFTEQGGVTVRAQEEDRYLIVSVSDTGPGIASEDQKRLFEPFQQLDHSLSRQHGGSGLGLAISRRFVEMHGGKMWLESAVGVGTTFLFSLPLEVARMPVPASFTRWFSPYHAYEARTRPFKAPHLDLTPRFVVVETGHALRHLLLRYYDSADVVGVGSMDEAVRELNRVPAQMLLINDPTTADGAPFAPDLANLPYGTPSINCWIPGKAEAAARLGVADYLIKPISQAGLLAALDALPGPVRTILIVDDSREALQLFGRMLTSAQREYHVLRAGNGARGLALLRERHPDVVLLDLVMPGMDGYQVLREKSADPSIRDIPAIAISAKDPVEQPIGRSYITVARSGGLSVGDLITCVQVIGEVLTPHTAHRNEAILAEQLADDDPEPPITSPG